MPDYWLLVTGHWSSVFTVCPACGLYTEEKRIDPAGPFAVCPSCGHAQPFVQLPLFIVTGASGAGKSAVALALPAALPECVALDMDILWGLLPATPDDGYRGYDNTWLRLAKNIGQGGRPVALLGSTTPERIEACIERRYFTTVHVLALVCDPATLTARLQARPAWRRAGDPAFIDSMLRFNRWFQEQAATPHLPLAVLNTSRLPLPDTVRRVAAWVRQYLPAGR